MKIKDWRNIYAKQSDMYLDWVNNFLTVPRFAEYYGISEMLANKLINEQRELHK